jgi:hypothetical protein
MAVRTWAEMRESIADRLVRQTGHDIAWWNDRIAAAGGPGDESALRAWLTSEGVTGYQQMWLVMERFGYPDFLLAAADELLVGQYEGKQQLRPILDAVVAAVGTFGPVDVQARKTYTSPLTARRTFAAVKPTTRTRVDVARWRRHSCGVHSAAKALAALRGALVQDKQQRIRIRLGFRLGGKVLVNARDLSEQGLDLCAELRELAGA